MDFFIDIQQVSALWQLLTLLLIGLIAYRLTPYICRFLTRWHWGKELENLLPKVVFTLLGIGLIEAVQPLLAYRYNTHILSVVEIFFIVILVFYVVRNVQQHIRLRNYWMGITGPFFIATWVFFLLYLIEWLSPVMQGLQTVQFKIGHNTISLFFIAQLLLTMLAMMFLALWLSRLMEYKLSRITQLDNTLRAALLHLFRAVILMVAFLLSLAIAGVDISALSLFSGSVLGVGLGLGMQRIITNYLGGFTLLLDKSVRLGDLVTIGDYHGVVRDLRIRYLVLRQLNGIDVVIPNEMAIEEAITNYSTVRHENIRVRMSVRIDPRSSVPQAIQLMLNVARKQAGILSSPPPIVVIKDMGGDENMGIHLVLSVWVKDIGEGLTELQSHIYMGIWQEFHDHNISIPLFTDTYPT